MHVLVVVGTRPEAIKMAPVVAAIDRSPDHSRTLCATLQQRAMLLDALGAFDLEPDRTLAPIAPSADTTDRLTHVAGGVRDLLRELRPDAVLVHGDTTSALGAALAAFHLRIPVGHVEAGLRSFDLDAPWPEEGHRLVIDRLSRWLFAPSERALSNLVREGTDGRVAVLTGNPIVDALGIVRPLAERRTRAGIPGLEDLDPRARIVTVTCHRREQHGAGLERIAAAIAAVAAARRDVEIVWPLHEHPAASAPIRALLSRAARVRLVPPLEYESFLALLLASELVVTDSGGVQEEAPALGRPLLVIRDQTERPEIVECGAARLVGTETASVAAAIEQLLDDPAARARMIRAPYPYGATGAADRIVAALR
jgi:UDP-N-acetylglucosamine 2-epimerase